MSVSHGVQKINARPIQAWLDNKNSEIIFTFNYKRNINRFDKYNLLLFKK